MNATKLSMLAIAILLAALFVVACGDDDGGDAVSPTADAGSPSVTGAGADTLEVTAQDFSFSLEQRILLVNTPITVAFENAGNAAHTFTIYRDVSDLEPIDGGDSGRVEGGAGSEFTVTFDEPGEYHFKCDFHPTTMSGTLEVQ